MNRLTSRRLPAAVERLREVLGGELDGHADADLLDRFARYGEHAAFDVLLRRHGPMVFGVCRRVLANPADAEDAFQATFLVLVRKARSIRSNDRLCPWLYQVAVRVALKARGHATRHAARHSEATDMIPDPATPADIPDWLPVLDAELNALPAKYREPLLLCELQGVSRADAAKTLAIPEGTLSSRLARGRELLRKRLLKHGTLLPASGLATLLTAGSVGRAALPAGLLAKTSESAAVVATGAALAGAVPAGAARLTDEVLKGMFLMKLKAIGGATLVAGLMAVGVLAAVPAGAPGQAEDEQPPAKVAKPTPQPTKPVADGKEQTDRDRVQGLWVLEKIELGKNAPADQRKEVGEAAGRIQLLVAGDIWWVLHPGDPNGFGVSPFLGKLHPVKNPKWLDLVSPDPNLTLSAIYELDGDKLRFCPGGSGIRPAEFDPGEEPSPMVYHHRRGKLPPAAGEPAIVGSWSGFRFPLPPSVEQGLVTVAAQRVEILDGYLFIHLQTGQWIGGRYSVDTTKNPKWIDVELVAPYPTKDEKNKDKKDEKAEKVTKLYGCYEAADGRLRLAFGTNGKRVFRPLDFDGAGDALFLSLSPTKDPLIVPLKPDQKKPEPKVKETAPPPKAHAEAAIDAARAELARSLGRDVNGVLPHYWPSRTIDIPVQLGKPDDQPSEVQLYYSHNHGEFQKGPKLALNDLKTLDNKKKGFQFTADQDGIYRFALQLVYPNGTVVPPRVRDLQRELQVVVDTVMPAIRIDATESGVKWEATDKNLDPKSIKLQCKYPGSSEWTTVVADFFPVDDYAWALPDGKVLEVRIEAADLAGNKAVSKTVRVPTKATAPPPRPKPTDQDEDETIRNLMKDGKYAVAEAAIREQLPKAKGLRLAEFKLRLGVCLMERAKKRMPPDAIKLAGDAAAEFQQAIHEATNAGTESKQGEWVRHQAELRLLQVLYLRGNPNDFLTAAAPVLEKSRGTVDELVIRCMMYAAFKQKGDNAKALETRDQMKALFDTLKDKPDAFPAKEGEYSREYWEKVWFGDAAKP